MTDKISKELYEEITGEDTEPIYEVYYRPRIDIDSFFFRVIKWAREQGYIISSTDRYAQVNCAKSHRGLTSSGICESQQEAVFICAEWILQKTKGERWAI